ncbi:MAG: 3',5'-cyclic-nucleotide phosphodiesterase [Betaproteobacteria bacterium]|nr:3',5'-cyclic-nucleotide phosphodiesterase [Betaproteobacteria bacterium]
MQVRVLGCSGGIGGHSRTTAFLIDHDILLDAGTGVEDLSLEELVRIDHVFLTHSHLDHIAGLPLLVDSAGALRNRPLVVHALPETIAALRAHVFNWVIWPDFTEIPLADAPWLVFEPIALNQTVALGERRLRALPANHTVPALGYQVASPRASLVFTGDTGPNDAFWQVVNQIPDLRFLIIETAFANRERELAVASRHLYPVQLAEELAKLTRPATVLITHLKPSDRHLIAQELQAWAGAYSPGILARGDLLTL